MHKRLDLGICSTGEQNDKTMEELRVKQRTVISRLKMKGNKNMTTFFFGCVGSSLPCVGFLFTLCGERGLLFVAVHELLIAVASLVAEHWL